MSKENNYWYKDAIIYETHVRAFFDSNNDGVGDFRGLIQKLDYLQDLGINCLWVLPFYPSPLRDDGYDIADYRGIHPAYGNMTDFRKFVHEAHRRGIRVITELVVNHTSDQHPWFQAARNAPWGSSKRNFYVWSDSDQRYEMARIIFTDSEKSNWSWDPVAKAYYWHRFFFHQPDLNYDNPAVLRMVIRALRFWLDQGVDGLRLDAVPYLVEREGTNCENLEETHDILKTIRRNVDAHYSNKMLLAEANQWPDDVRPYFGDGDECHMSFHFPLMPRIFMALRQEDRHPITDIMRQTPDVPESCQWALFLRNHDELTLEMVTDEERDYMYRAYAADPRMRVNIGIRRRLAPLMDNSRRRIELLNSLLFSLRGTPIIYYGDEIGMGDNIYLGDRNGVRTPMQWSSDRNAGFSRADFARLYAAPIMDPVYGYQSINVEAQQRDPSSLLNWMKRLIALRNRFQTFGRGSMHFLLPKNRKVLAYVRSYKEEQILCVANLSRFVQPAELDLSKFAGLTPVEMLGRTEFPPIRQHPFFVTLAPHSFYWFQLLQVPETLNVRVLQRRVEELEAPPVVEFDRSWEKLQEKNMHEGTDNEILPPFLLRQRWFAAKTRQIESVQVIDRVFLETARQLAFISFAKVNFSSGDSQTYVIPLSLVPITEPRSPKKEDIVAHLRSRSEEGLLIDAMADNTVCEALLWAIGDEIELHAKNGVLRAKTTSVYREFARKIKMPLRFRRGLGEQSNTSVVYGDQLILKLFRKVEPGPNPEFEILRFLTERTDFDRVPQLAGVIEYRPNQDQEASTIAILQSMVANQGNAWDHTQDELRRFFERTQSHDYLRVDDERANRSLFDVIGAEIPQTTMDAIGIYLIEASTLGKRTAELHLALASDSSDPAFAPEKMTDKDYRNLSRELLNNYREAIDLLQQNRQKLPENLQSHAEHVLQSSAVQEKRFTDLTSVSADIARIRIHGDYHLGQVLWVKNDFVILDFEGEPARPIAERRTKQSPLKDVAGMIRSFSYAAYANLFSFAGSRPSDFLTLENWAKVWEFWTSAAFLNAYLRTAAGAEFLPTAADTFRTLLSAFLIDKAVYELKYELNNRPEWVRIPLAGIRNLV